LNAPYQHTRPFGVADMSCAYKGVESDNPIFTPLGLCGLLVFTCRISINTENVRETEHYIKKEIRARDSLCVLEVCWTRVVGHFEMTLKWPGHTY